MLIRDENEMLKKGQTPTPVLTDNHSEHILSHKEVYSDPDVRNDPTIMNAAMQHIQAHIDLMRQVPPDLAAVLSGQPLPPPPPPPGAPGPANAPEPTVQGVHLPEPPNGTPLQTAANYQQATA
ncbi:hypothetical protein, partial [Glaesserella parasuis]|uniref:hypothetical protein n=1 Tax=Glaesserella parasuis TaxID=738 RepID=UPI003F382AEA